MLYLVFCLTDGSFRDVRDEFDSHSEQKFVGRHTSNGFLNGKMPPSFWEKNSPVPMKLLMALKGETYLLDPEKILYLEVHGRIVQAHLEGTDKIYETYAQLKDVEEPLEKLGFLRISRFYIVSIRHITAIQGDEVRLSSGDRILIGRSFKQKLKIVLIENSIPEGSE